MAAIIRARIRSGPSLAGARRPIGVDGLGHAGDGRCLEKHEEGDLDVRRLADEESGGEDGIATS
jgi:hypothetical protein